jgi:hypothetical protein
MRMCSVQKNYGKPAHLAGTLAVACLLLASASFGQEEEQRKPDKQILRKLSEWVGIFTLYSDVDLSDRVDLKEYSEAADLASAFLTNPELSAHIAEFKAATFVNVYPLGLVNHPEWLFRKLNDISKAQYSTLNAPHVMVEVQFTPADNFTGYLVTLVFKGNDPLKDEWIRLANQQAGISLAAQKFASPLQAKDKVNAAIVAGLDALKASIGNTFVPNLAIRCNDEMFLNNQVIELWQRADSTGVVLQAVTGEGTPITSLLTWTGARKREGQSAVFLPTQAGDVPVSVQRGTEKITVRMRVKEFSIDLNQLLKKLIVEALSQKRQQAATRLLELRQDSVANAVAIRNLLAQIEQGNFPMEATGNTLFPVFTNPVTLTDSSAFRDASLPRTANLRELKKRQRLHHNIRRNLNVEALADLLVNNPSQLDSLLNQLVRSSGQLIARLIVGKDRQGQENVARDIVVDYVNEHLKQLTDVLPQEAEKPLPTPARTGTTAAFNANQWVYANPLLPINNLSNFINNLADSARKRNTYVFIHYSQDVSTDAYLLRAPQAVPRGLPPGARFVTVTLVNIPGSVNYMLLGSKGRVPGSGGQNQEEEIWRYLFDDDDEESALVATFFNSGWEECYRGLKAVTTATNFENRKELPVTKLNTDCYGGALFQLTSGELLWRTPDDLGNSTYYVLYPDERQWQPFKLPPFDCTSCDIAWLVSQVQTAAVRYLTPIEDIIVVLEGKDLDGMESSKLLAGVFLVVDIVPGGKIFRPVKKLGQAGLKGTKKLLVTVGKTSKAYIGEVVDGVYKPFKWIKPDKVDEVLEVTDEVTYLAEDGVQRVGKLEVVRSGIEYGVRVLSNALKFTAKQIDDYIALATKQNDKLKVMLGMWDNGSSSSYISKAGKDYTYFDFGDKFQEAYNLVGKNDDEIWRINKEFIDRQKAAGKEFWFSHDPFSPKNEQFFAREVNYLIDLKVMDFVKVGDLWKAVW